MEIIDNRKNEFKTVDYPNVYMDNVMKYLNEIEKVKEMSDTTYNIIPEQLNKGSKEEYSKYGINDIVVTNEENYDFETVKKVCKEQLQRVINKIRL